MSRLPSLSAILSLVLLPVMSWHAPAAAQTAVTTYHYDTLRSGWNNAETTLTAANAGSVQLQQSVKVDSQVDAQPLLVPGVNLGGAGTHDVLYVVTENNSIYGIDAESGAVLLQRNLGSPVPENDLPGACDNNGETVGIQSTPVIDPAAATLYVMAYTYENNVAAYYLHAVSLATLNDTLAPRLVAASRKLSDGSTYDFQAAVTRQRPALLLSGGTIYAGFGSFCDEPGNISRGWVLGWNEATLKPIPVRDLQDRQATAPDDTFLNSIWMSGYGLAADSGGAIYFATANSDPSGKSWNKRLDLSESVVRMSADLSTIEGYFTPVGKVYGQQRDDMIDGDVGSGGVLLLPDQSGNIPHLAVAGGKLTPLFLLNRDSLGGRGGELQNAESFGCWCGNSSYVTPAGKTIVVSSTGQAITSFTLKTKPSPKLIDQVSTVNLSTGQDAGFFTSISSNGTATGSAVVWAVSRPTDPEPADVMLYAFDPSTQAELTTQVAGTWPNTTGDADLVPVVANGRVYVASYKQVTIFGLGAPAAHVAVAHPRPAPAAELAAMPHSLTGIVTETAAAGFTLRLRDGSAVRVNTEAARRTHQVALPVAGQAARVRGDWDGKNFAARAVLHAKANAALWAKDR
jgi:hypothetical protein